MKRAKQFRPAGMMSANEQRSNVDRWRGSASKRGYNHRWQKARQTFLARSPLCIGCEAVGRITAATVVDHVVPHDGDQAKFWDASHWQACCKWHHDSIKQMLERMYQRRKIPATELWLTSDTAKRLTMGVLSDDA